MNSEIPTQNYARIGGFSLPKAAAVLTATIGLLVILEWTLNFKTLAYTSNIGHTFKFNTAICFLLIGLSLLLRLFAKRSAQIAARILSATVILIATTTLTQDIFRVNFGIDELIVRDLPNAPLTSSPGRMAPQAALNFIFSAAGILLWRQRTKNGYRPTEFLAVIVLASSFVAIVAYIYGASALYRPTLQTGIAIHAGITFLILSIGMLAVKPERGIMSVWFAPTRGGTILRFLLPGVFLVLFSVNFFGEAGVAAGWFQKPVGDALVLFLSDIILAALIWWAVYTIHQSDIEAEKFNNEREALLFETERAREAAENANRLKDEFLATVSHELRTPLNSMLGWSLIYQTEPTHENMQRAAEVIQRQGRHQLQLIEDLLDISRIISGNLRIEPVNLRLESIISNTLETVRPAAEAKNISLAINSNPELPDCPGDAARLQQIFWNLLSNAIKFTPAVGSVRVHLDFENGSFARIAVSDTGEGIAPEFLPYIFERFSQAEKAQARRHGGLGLGLAIAKNLVELHGGTITAESEGKGHGATFIVRLPLNHKNKENSM